MGRAGGGGHSGGGHSSGRSGGGHHVGGGGFGGGSSHSSFGGFSGGSSHHSSGSHYSGGFYGGGFGGPRPRPNGGGSGCGGGCLTYLIIVILLIWLVNLGSFASCVSFTMSNLIPTKILSHSQYNKNDSKKSSKESTKNRKKLNTKTPFDKNCVKDELGWIGDTKHTGEKLKTFYNKTGIQPYVLFRKYDPTLQTDEEKEKWTIDYYDSNFEDEHIFLYIYFAEENTDQDVGYMAYALGKQTEGILDEEAMSIFWENIDKNWYSDMSTDDVIINSMNDTAETIMHHKTNWRDFVKWILIIIAIIIAGTIIISLVKEKHKRDKEKAEEDQKILETPVHDIADDLAEKYTEEQTEKETGKPDDVETIDPNDIDIV